MWAWEPVGGYDCGFRNWVPVDYWGWCPWGFFLDGVGCAGWSRKGGSMVLFHGDVAVVYSLSGLGAGLPQLLFLGQAFKPVFGWGYGYGLVFPALLSCWGAGATPVWVYFLRAGGVLGPEPMDSPCGGGFPVYRLYLSTGCWQFSFSWTLCRGL